MRQVDGRAITVGGTLALCVLALLLAGATSDSEPRQTDTHPGQEHFMRYCSACHGADGAGRGPVANVMQPRPADLTRLYLKYGQPLSASLVDYIDGRKMPRAHGTSDMPVWGERLYEELPADVGREIARRGTIWLIVDFLETLQRGTTS
jgi:mono/diheme cytochrome c family protein